MNLQGERSSVLKRMISNFCDVKYSDFVKEDLTNKEKSKIKHAKNVLKKQLYIRNMIFKDLHPTIEEFVSEMNEIKKEFDFDMVYINHATFIGQSFSNGYDSHIIAKVFRELNIQIAKAHNCVVITPVNSNKDIDVKNNKVISSSDVSFAFEFARNSGFIISINQTEDEKKNEQMRIFLEKQVVGDKGVQFGIYTDFDSCNLIKGEFYVC